VPVLDNVYTTEAKIDFLKEIATWAERSHSTDSGEYLLFESRMIEEFGEILESPLLEDSRKVQQLHEHEKKKKK
jgi:hypothetical protein